MELKVYFQILLKKWWIVIPVFLITLTAGLVLTYTATPIYTAKATYIVVPNSSFGTSGRDIGSALDLLGRREEIASTFSQIASSRMIKGLAFRELSLEVVSQYSVNSSLVLGTNILKIEVIGPNPVAARDLANTIGTTTEEHVQGLYEVFTLLPLDEATIPKNPSSPNVSMNIFLSAVFGLILGAGVAFLAEYLEAPLASGAEIATVNIIDDQTGVYNKPYFLQRLNMEMARAKRNRYPLSLALMRIDNLDLIKGTNASRVRTEILHQMGRLANQYLREEDLVAYFENDTFAFLLPDMTGENAKAIMEYLQERVGWTPFESRINNLKFNPKSIVGITNYEHDGTSRNELIVRAEHALQLAEADGQNKTYFITNLNLVNNPHVQADIPA